MGARRSHKHRDGVGNWKGRLTSCCILFFGGTGRTVRGWFYDWRYGWQYVGWSVENVGWFSFLFSNWFLIFA